MLPNRDQYRRAVAWLICSLCILATALSCLADAMWTARGTDVRSTGGLYVDCSNTARGYVLAKVEGGSQMKLRISCGSDTYTYDVNSSDYEVFPLQLGNGYYKVSAYRRVTGNKYTKQAEIGFNVNMPDPNTAFLYPNQYVNYTKDSPAVAKAEELCKDLKTDKEKVEAIRSFMVRNFTYDYVRALTAPKSYLGDVDGCFKTRMGLCQDLAVVAACMLRTQGIPTQLAIGWAGNIYHAWNYVLIDGKYELLDITGEMSFMAADTVYITERIY